MALFYIPWVLVVFVGVFWVYAFVQLMLLEPRYFSGPHDKILWVVSFIFAMPLAPFAFYFWKQAILEEHAIAAHKTPPPAEERPTSPPDEGGSERNLY